MEDFNYLITIQTFEKDVFWKNNKTRKKICLSICFDRCITEYWRQKKFESFFFKCCGVLRKFLLYIQVLPNNIKKMWLLIILSILLVHIAFVRGDPLQCKSWTWNLLSQTWISFFKHIELKSYCVPSMPMHCNAVSSSAWKKNVQWMATINQCLWLHICNFVIWYSCLSALD